MSNAKGPRVSASPESRLEKMVDAISESMAQTVHEVIGGENIDSIVILVQGLDGAEGVHVAIGTTLSPDDLPMVLYRSLDAMLSPEMMAEIGKLMRGEGPQQ